jgi:hypothetical protein
MGKAPPPPIFLLKKHGMVMVASALALLTWLILPVEVDGLSQVIQVCQNKDCCRRFQRNTVSLPDTFHQLLDSAHSGSNSNQEILVESTGCLGLCGEGPNVGYIDRDPKSVVYAGAIERASDAVQYLQGTVGIHVPKELIATVKVLDKASSCTYYSIVPCLVFPAAFFRVAKKSAVSIA